MCTEMLFNHWSDIKGVKTQIPAISTGASAMEHRQVIFMLLFIWRSIDSSNGAYDYTIRQRAIKNIITHLRDVLQSGGRFSDDRWL